MEDEEGLEDGEEQRAWKKRKGWKTGKNSGVEEEEGLEDVEEQREMMTIAGM